MRYIIIGVLTLFFLKLMAQPADDHLTKLRQEQSKYESFKCTIDIHVEVTDVDIPDKQIYIVLEKGQKPKIQSKGLLILPKKGLIGQFNEIIKGEYQAIKLYEKSDTLVYKIVSLDKKADWVTADIHFLKHNYQIYRMDISTYEFGEFLIYYHYDINNILNSTEIEFETSSNKIPLKFLGRSQKKTSKNTSGNSKGVIYLKYSDFELL